MPTPRSQLVCIEGRLRILASALAIVVGADAIMRNHYHVVVKLYSNDDWPDDKVLHHWQTRHHEPFRNAIATATRSTP